MMKFRIETMVSSLKKSYRARFNQFGYLISSIHLFKKIHVWDNDYNKSVCYSLPSMSSIVGCSTLWKYIIGNYFYLQSGEPDSIEYIVPTILFQP